MKQSMMRDKQQAVDTVLKVCNPARMSKRESKEYLEAVIEDLQSNVKALGEELADEKD